MNNPKPLKPHEKAEVDATTKDHGAKQPYASELDDRELEHAQKDERPVQPKGKATKPR